MSEKDKLISSLLQKYQDYSPEHLHAVVNYLKKNMGKRVIVVLDNMDQKSYDLQDKLYQTGHEFVYSCGLIVVISMRENTFRRIMQSPTFNAFASREFHVKAQPLDLILEKRLTYLKNRLTLNKVSLTTSAGKTLDVLDFDRFIRLIRRSLLNGKADPRILECVTAISNGNIREQLDMLYSFLVSGQTKIDDYFWNYTRNETSKIPFHETLHSILYEDHKFFDEGSGHRIMNVFEPSPRLNSSHFTSLRILAYFHEGLGQTGELHAVDFVKPQTLVEEFSNYGWSKEEFFFHINRMVKFGLMMPESGNVRDIGNDNLTYDVTRESCALTKCGLYYLNTLFLEFAYFSAMACDTSMMEEEAVYEIEKVVRDTISIAKIPMTTRRTIAKRFVSYLYSRERTELRGVISKHPVIGNIRFTPRMIKAIRNPQIERKK